MLKEIRKINSASLRRHISKAKQWCIRKKRHIAWNLSAKDIAEESLVSDFCKQNILKTGDIVIVHSALSSIGKVEGGPETVCRAFQKILGESGTLLMPSYHQPHGVLSMLNEGRIIDLRSAPSTMGKLTETFRNMPGVIRSSHPYSSVCALGRFAKEMTDHHAKSPFMCGPGTPIQQLLERRGKYMGLGVDIRVNALYHVLEENWEDFPLRVHCKHQFSVKYIDPSGHTVERSLAILDPEVSRNRIDHERNGKWIRTVITNDMVEKRILKQFFLGQAKCWVVDAVDFYEELRALAARGITIYTTKDMAEGMII